MRAAQKYSVIHRFVGKYTISAMCGFFAVSCSGYYKWRKRDKSPDQDKPIGELIGHCQEETNQTYGYRRVKLWLLRETGLIINHKAVLRIMNKYNLLAKIRRPRPLYQRLNHFKRYENRLNRNFETAKPNQKWVTDISYIQTKEGTLYLSMIKDLYDNFIVAYDAAAAQDNALVYRTIRKAKEEVADGLTLHSDQGFQYTSHGYFNLTKEYGILPSMSRVGTPLDNAPAESFFGTLKSECVNRQKLVSIRQAKELIDNYIHFYNYERIQLKTKLTPYEKRCQLE